MKMRAKCHLGTYFPKTHQSSDLWEIINGANDDKKMSLLPSLAPNPSFHRGALICLKAFPFAKLA